MKYGTVTGRTKNGDANTNTPKAETVTISIADDFTTTPGTRYISDGPFSAEEFRNRVLIPAWESAGQVRVLLDGTEGLAASFLEEAFGGLTRIYNRRVLHKLLLVSEDADVLEEASSYIEDMLDWE